MWFWEMLQGAIEFLVGLLPSGPLPPEPVVSGAALLGQLIAKANGLCMWVDFPAAAVAFGIAFAAWSFGLLVRVARVVLGFFIG